MLMSIAFNYAIGTAIERSKPKSKKAKTLLTTGIVLNLTLLAYYKYANFLLTSVDAIIGTDWNIPNIILPLGISFYTFTQTA